MIELEQVTCRKCGEAFTREPLGAGWLELSGPTCLACKPPPDPNRPVSVTLSYRYGIVPSGSRGLLPPGKS